MCDTTVARDEARCFAMVLEDTGVKAASPAPTGLSPADILSAYNLPAGGGAGRTVGIVVAFDAPTAEADLTHYRAQFGLPALTAGRFKKVDQRGGTAYPAPDEGWAGEAALDVDAVTAAAPQANIVLVVADDNSFENLGAAVNQARAQGAEVVNNSYGTGYDSSAGSGEDETLLPANEQYYKHPGVAILASSGDDDYGVSFPASSNYVTAIGGTSLVKDTGAARGWSESVWHNTYGGPGSGCSIVFVKVPGQSVTGCEKRSVADVSAVADPETGLSVYCTYAGGEWSQYGGTSLSSPLIAGMYALAGKPAAGTYPNTYPYLKPGAFFDVTAGNNGTCTPAVLCTAGAGYDGPTGLGTPNGVSGFAATETGTVSGTVTHDGAPLEGATVTIGDAATATTGTDGTYTAAVPAGTYTVTFSAYGYKTVTKTGVVVTVGNTATASAALVAVPSRAVSGTVKDGSGHGYPLYSMITIDGAPGGPVYTDPFDGSYSVNLPQGQTFTLTYTPMIPGYLPVQKTIKIGAADRSLSVAAKVDPAAENVPGYTTKLVGAVQGFDGATAPAGWTVEDKKDPGWTFTDVGNRGNLTGGTGGFAIIDSDKSGTGKAQDSSLVSPLFNLAGKTNAVVEFDSYFKKFSTSNGTVNHSSDGGITWKTVFDVKSLDQSGHVRIAIPAADATATIKIRFHYTGSYAYYWEIDNVFVGLRSTVAVPGGLLAGIVKDGNTGEFVGGAKVTSADLPELTATTGPTGDPAVGNGYYWLFSKLTGARTFTIAKSGYGTARSRRTCGPTCSPGRTPPWRPAG
ncbi:MAG: carboxypeptidase regulatory-like domain-containing protein [Nakamurella sp.]